MMKFLLTVGFGAVLGSAATLWYIYENHADRSERVMMRSTVIEYLPFAEEWIPE